MYSPLQIELIRLLGSKELSDGLIINRSGILFKSIQGNHFINIHTGKYIKSQENPIETMSCEKIGHLPTLEDLFIKAEEKGLIIDIVNVFGQNYDTKLDIFNKDSKRIQELPYNPKLKPYQQTEETIQEILKLFK